jgi:arylsulfatase A-like enzyme
MRSLLKIAILTFICAIFYTQQSFPQKAAKPKPNIVFIYADDLGYGDISCYGATKIITPNIDKLAGKGILFTNAHSSSATCTPSRYSLLTGQFAWRKDDTKVAPGNASLIIDTNIKTLPLMLQHAGYTTGVVGKWHLGLGPSSTGPDWNGDIKPGPLELGFNYAFIMPATGDRTPCVYVENHKVLNLDPADPIYVRYDSIVGNDPTGKDHPELLKLKPSHGHNQTIVNGISRIGYMSGGRSARWVDEDMADVFTSKAKNFIIQNKEHPFFLYFATHDIHVPRVPNNRFLGKSNLGVRGDAILELDWTVGDIEKTLDSLGLRENTIFIFSSDNGPVVDDGYADGSVETLDGHKPAGPFRGGKYSAYDGGTRIPLIISWPGQTKSFTSDALVCQVDFFASFAALAGGKISAGEAPDSENILDALSGKSSKGRNVLVEQGGALSVTKDGWKYIEPHKGLKRNLTGNELGNDSLPQLYNLKIDLGETNNVATQFPDKVKELAALLKEIEQKGGIGIRGKSNND